MRNFYFKIRIGIIGLLILLGKLSSGQIVDIKEDASNPLPNIILIMADDMGYECLGCNGSLDYSTPTLDRLADNGIRFTNCFSQPLCTPSRVKIMTGKYNYRNYEYFGYLNPDQKTFGNYLKDAGYNTCIAGKWQLNGIYHDLPGNQDLSRPQHFGFDEYCLWQLNKTGAEGERYANPLIIRNGEEIEGLKDAYGPDIFSDFICDFIDENKERPFFVYYPMVLVHDPFVPTPDSPEWNEFGDRYKKSTAYFDDMVGYVDKVVSKIEDKLKDSGIANNTIVIFTGDNGTHPSIITETVDKEVTGGKGSSLNTGNHVPLFVSWPAKIKKGRVFSGLVDFTDILPTIADVAKLNPASYYTDGKSFFSVINQTDGKTSKEEVFIHYSPRWGRFKSNRWVLNEYYKLYQNGEFYNTMNDPDEKNPIVSPTNQEKNIKKKFEKVLDSKEKEFPFKNNDVEFKP
ncbi:sulfatase-like hydrolase/transferase [Maribellus maritimus]|uniref:sulfatase-like hydrolase/transferase n=1 Tax=Maribellus maritimus TaxID=2870838 RepID=UPI001EEB4BE4|nr:sulfatase-like hydrolase/transferase [Maribellus maritimus]MCG6187849.1 sulfatase-like hydrolase/transferase [Maribellus maritimus]